jgi:hypothetical protein
MISIGVRPDSIRCDRTGVKRVKFMPFRAYDTILSMANKLLVPERSLRFQHEGTFSGPEFRYSRTPLAHMGGIAKQNGMIPKRIGGVSDHAHLLSFS